MSYTGFQPLPFTNAPCTSTILCTGVAIAEPARPSIRAATESRRFIAALIVMSPCQLTGPPSYGGTRRRLMMLSETIQWQTQCQAPHGLWLNKSANLHGLPVKTEDRKFMRNGDVSVRRHASANRVIGDASWMVLNTTPLT